MLKPITRHRAAARKRKEVAARFGPVDRFEQVTSRMVREERKADPALMLLGIGLVDNATIHMLGARPEGNAFTGCPRRSDHVGEFPEQHASVILRLTTPIICDNMAHIIGVVDGHAG